MRLFAKSSTKLVLVFQGAEYEKVALSTGETYLFSLNQKGQLQLLDSEDAAPMATLYEDNGNWVLTMMSEEACIVHQGENVASLILDPEVRIELLDAKLKIVDIQNEERGLSAEQTSPLKVVLLSSVLASTILWLVMGSGNKDKSEQEHNVKTNELSIETSSEKLTASNKSLTAVASNDSQGLSEYKLALSYYDAGNLTAALSYLEKSLVKKPDNKIVMIKLIEIENNMDRKATLHYQNGCGHARYMRNYEAKLDFRVTRSLIRNKQDERYVDAVRMLDALDRNEQRVLCKVKNRNLLTD